MALDEAVRGGSFQVGTAEQGHHKNTLQPERWAAELLSSQRDQSPEQKKVKHGKFGGGRGYMCGQPQPAGSSRALDTIRRAHRMVWGDGSFPEKFKCPPPLPFPLVMLKT